MISSRGAKSLSPGSWMGGRGIGRGMKITARTAKGAVPSPRNLVPRRREISWGTVGATVRLHPTRGRQEVPTVCIEAVLQSWCSTAYVDHEAGAGMLGGKCLSDPAP
ncbi:hypothetical protein MCOR29_010537 [Pyricularia oryzae]|uniref:Uncharacterized protein n=1 Tax=Pyricularia grisea TaxID=148305 RepID=A0ABQ8NDA3_PYRGI|nr:hypothetical protein MCOR19_005886 [Pyricularia oryzae]KAI6295205.1 hypothetical protein MCOR33_007873 [Pyricularia grisea]KAI6289694.1 hypothetical protein MCOR34_010683 [Pyricularia oryzae]KAI6305307.1 hypothetical protein MCOR29_010537 [Pyricularia oryzae]KAI6327922.1 hypothetical protein MCOR30_006134 [Pyricularia oryzae]